jgi:CubicO group peptidase (beta-lactamase class C family)
MPDNAFSSVSPFASRRRFLRSGIGALGAAFVPFGRSASAGVNSIAERRGRKSLAVDALFDRWSVKNETPGAAVRVVYQGETLHAKEYGLANIRRDEPIVADTRFLLASLTKPFTALAIMMLVEQGDLSYDHRLTEFFPQFRSYARSISVRHLLWHTAGLREYDDLFALEGRLDFDWPRSACSAPSKYEPTSAETLEMLARHSRLFPAGEKHLYSNSAYLVLGQIIEKVSGQSYPKFIRTRILIPAGMTQSSVPVARWRDVPKRATSYEFDAKEGKFYDIDYAPTNQLYGADGIYSTADDLLRFDAALYTRQLVRQSTLDDAFRPGTLNDGTRTGYGFGWIVEPDYVWHNGEFLGFRTYLARHRSLRFTVLVLANCKELNADALGDDIASIYLDG